jgi:DNA (cytosine-5)-methyltransferase 1
LALRFPGIPIFDDVSTLTKDSLDQHGLSIDVIVGGFPCQDLSVAGKRAGLDGERSGLWFQFHRLIQEIKPKFIIAENVSALRSKGLDRVLGSLAEIGYDAEWHCIPASAVGAPHRRDRIWIVAYPNLHDRGDGSCSESPQREARVEPGCSGQRQSESQPCENLAHPDNSGLQGGQWLREYFEEDIRGKEGAHRPASQRCPVSGGQVYSWDAEPPICRVADGVPNRVDRLKQLGNAVVPQIPEILGRAILRRFS